VGASAHVPAGNLLDYLSSFLLIIVKFFKFEITKTL
jgi:hypothetical protein